MNMLFRETNKGFRENQMLYTEDGPMKFGSPKWKEYIRKQWEAELERTTTGKIKDSEVEVQDQREVVLDFRIKRT